MIRYGDLELAPDAVGRLLVSLEEIGEHRLASRIARVGDVDGAELLLTPADRSTILRALATIHVPELAALSRALDEESHRGEPPRLSRDDRTQLRATRLAANEAFFRSLNERLESDTPASQPLIVLCECADEDCAQRLELARGEYETARSDPSQFVVAHDHADLEIEEVVLRTDRFEMVRKIGIGAEIAARLDS
jgi:hypothetical protein